MRPGRARRVRRRAGLVQPRRPGSRHHITDKDAERGSSAHCRDQPAVRAWPARRDPAADVRRPGRDPVVLDDDQGRRTVHFQEWWVRLHAAVPAAEIHRSRRGRRESPRPECSRPSRRGLRPAAAVQPGGEHRHHPGRSRHRRGGQRQDRGGCLPIIGGAPVRAWPMPAWRHRGADERDGGGRRTTAPGCWTAGSSTSRTRPRWMPRNWPGSPSGRSRCNMTDLSASAEIARAALDLAAG